MKNKKLNFIMFTIALLFMSVTLAQASTLSIEPTSSSVEVGEIFTITINLDTQGSNTDGVGLRSINYNPNILELQDTDNTKSGVQIEAGTLYPVTMTNSANTTTGKINLSQITTGGNTFNGQGTLATLTFKAKANGTSPLTFDFVPKLTTDTNVVSGGDDILTSVSGGRVVVGDGVYAGNVNSIVGPFRIGSQTIENKLLQKMLSGDKTIYPEAITSGYYGSLTTKAVQRFQVKYNIVSSGSPKTTGYGLVGPKTMKKLNEIFNVSYLNKNEKIITNNTDLEKEELIRSIKNQILEIQKILKVLIERLLQSLQEQIQ